MTVPLHTLRETLEEAAKRLPAPGELGGEAEVTRSRLLERIHRDLLPRIGGASPILIAAIAGPNNVGKSSLFNALVHNHLSPARAEGGLTKQCLAAVHPDSFTADARAILAQRFELVELAAGARAPVDQPGPPGRLFVLRSEAAPPRLLLLDTPDFDSVYLSNRENTEALLVTVDLLLFVVSRHTYQNAAVVQFLKEGVGHGRPYALVYNEASRLEGAAEHLDKLSRDVGVPPVARFAGLHQPEVETQGAYLSVQPLDGAPPLSELLSDAPRAEALKARAMAASVSDAAAELEVLAAASGAAVSEPERLRARVRHELFNAAANAAVREVPADILVEAFRDELDARSTVHRFIRLPFRGLVAVLGFAGRQLKKAFAGEDLARPSTPTDASHVLEDSLRRAFEALAAEVNAWRGDPRVRAALQASLGGDAFGRLRETLAQPELSAAARDREALYRFCRELIGRELTGGARDEALQALATLVYSVPAGAAAAVSLTTGGLGHDAVVWVGSLLTTPVMERFVDLLGAQIREEVTRRWREERGRSLAAALEPKLFGELLPLLDAQVGRLETAAVDLRARAAQLRG